MPTANEVIQDRTVRHGVLLTRLQNSEVRRVLQVMDREIIPDIERILEKRLRVIRQRGFDPGPRTTERLNRMLSEFRDVTRQIRTKGLDALRPGLLATAASEAEWQDGLIKSASGIELQTTIPTQSQLRAVLTRPFDGAPLSDWFNGISQRTQRGLERAVRQGVVEGETMQQITRRVRDTAFVPMRHNVEAITRSAVQHASMQARQMYFEDNSDIIKSVQWSATLDADTCPECAGLDGRVFDVDSGRRPPAHPNCRCSTAPILKSWRQLGFDIDELPPGTRASMNGQVPESMTYNRWLRQQVQSGNMDVVEEALGPSRAKAFAAGGMDIRQFTNRRGRTLTLKELRGRERDIFERLDIRVPGDG